MAYAHLLPGFGLTVSARRGLPIVMLIGMAMAGSAQARSPAESLAVVYPPIAGRPAEFVAAANQPVARNGYVAAPMPDQNAVAPRSADAPGPAFAPGIFQSKGGYRGDGFTPGSSPQIAQQPKHLPLPGISMKVPLY